MGSCWIWINISCKNTMKKLYKDVPPLICWFKQCRVPWIPITFSKQLHFLLQWTVVWRVLEVRLDMIQIHVRHLVAVCMFIPRLAEAFLDSMIILCWLCTFSLRNWCLQSNHVICPVSIKGWRTEILWSGQRVKLATIGLLSFGIRCLIVHISLQAVLLFPLISPRVFQTPSHSLPSLGVCSFCLC